MTSGANEGGKRDRATVALAHANSYARDDIERAVADVLDRLGGMGAFVSPGERVLIKPNLLSAKSPDRAITTHPMVIEALIDAVRSEGGEPSIGDSPGGAVRGLERVWENTGMQDLAERTGVPLVSFEASGSVEVQGALGSYRIAKPVVDADVVINVPKMKTHILTMYTGCIKNTFGSIPGFAKGRLHSTVPRPEPFSRHIADIYGLVRPRLHVMDAVVAMEGDGPSGGKPREVGAIMAGSDGVAVDSVASRMMGYEEGAVHAIRIAGERGLGVARGEDIDVVGAAVSSFDLSGFALPKTRVFDLLPSFLVRSLRPWIWIYPEMSKEWGCRAHACGLCVASCPVDAIEMTDPGPVVDRRACIECLCCHEVCPEQAVRIRLSWLARRFA